MIDADPKATVISIDGVGAYDLISRSAMLEGLLRMEGGDQILPFARCFYGINIFCGKTRWAPPRSSSKGKEGSKGILSCPCFLHWVNKDDELVFANLDDICAVCRPDRVGVVFAILQQEFQSHAHIQHLGKTQVWNRGGVVPVGIEHLTRLARRVKPDAVVWRGDTDLPLSQQGIQVLGVPIGQPPRATFWMRAVRPELTDSFAVRHDEDVWSCTPGEAHTGQVGRIASAW